MNLELARPWALLLLPVGALVLWAWRHRARPAISWPGAVHLAPMAAQGIDRWRWMLRGLSLLAAVLALAGPRWPLPGDRLDAEGVAIMLVVDVSGSMAEPDFERGGEKISRLDGLKSALNELISRRAQDRIGVVFFSTLPDTGCPLTLDHSAVKRVLASADPRGTPTENDTDLGDAIAFALHRRLGDPGRTALVICSDGEHNTPSPALTPRQAAQLAAASLVPIHAIDVGPANGPGHAGLDAITRMTGGTCFTANDARGLNVAVEDLDRMGRELAPDYRARRYREGDRLLALAAFAYLLVAFALDFGPWLRVP